MLALLWGGGGGGGGGGRARVNSAGCYMRFPVGTSSTNVSGFY